MGWNEWPYWLRGGIIFMILSVILVPLIIYLGINTFNTGKYLIQMLLPFAYFGLMALGMRGSPTSSIETVLVLGFALIITAAIYFTIGVILGIIYGKSQNKKITIGLMTLFFIIFISLLILRGGEKDYINLNSAGECSKFSNLFKENWDVNYCYVNVARDTKNISVCNLIKNVGNNIKGDEDYKYYCYEEVAHYQDNPKICEIIPQDNHRRDGCFVWFVMCDRVQDAGWKRNCLEVESTRGNNTSY